MTMSLLDKRSVCLRVTRHHRRLSSSCESVMDEADREVSTLTDRAFRSLCIGDEAVYSDAEFAGLSPSPGSCLLKPLADEHLRKVPETAPGLATKKHCSNGATNAVWQHKNVSSLLSAFTTGKNGDGAKMANGMLAESSTDSWDKSALLSIQRELAEFSTDFHSSFADHGKHCGSSDKKSKGKKAAKDTTGPPVGKSNSKSKHSKASSKLRKLNSRNFFLHSEFSPFQAWKDLQHFPFGQEHAHISDLLPSDHFPHWGGSAFYRHLAAAHTLEPQAHTHTPQLTPAHRPAPEQGSEEHTHTQSQKTETAQRSQHSHKHTTAQAAETGQKTTSVLNSVESGQIKEPVEKVESGHRSDPGQERLKSRQRGGKGVESPQRSEAAKGTEGLQGVESSRQPLGASTELLARPGEADTPSVPQSPSVLELRHEPVAPWRRNRVRARSAAPAGHLEKSSPAADSRPPTSTELARKQEVRRMEDQSSDSATPFNITHLLTPVIPCRQDTESLDPPALPALFSPTTLDVPAASASDRKPSPDTRARESYRSIASSLLFNLKDNRKRVKARYSPPKFRPSDPCDPTGLDWGILGKDLSDADTGTLPTAVMRDGTTMSPVLESTSASELPGNQRAESRPVGGEQAGGSTSQGERDTLPAADGTADRSPGLNKAGHPSRRTSPEAEVAMETQEDRGAGRGQSSRPIRKEREPPKKSVKERVKELQGQNNVNQDSALRSRERPPVCPPPGLQATSGAMDYGVAAKDKRPPEVPAKPSVLPKPAKQPPPVPARVKHPPRNEADSSAATAEAGLGNAREAAFSSEAKHAFSARQNNYIKSQRSAALLDEEEESEDWDEVREVALLKQMQAEIETHRERQQGEPRAQPHTHNAPSQNQSLLPAHDITPQSKEISMATDPSEVDRPPRQDLASPVPERRGRKGVLSLKGNTQAKRHLFSHLEQNHSQPPGRQAKNVEVDKYDLATMALEEVIAEREERKRKGQRSSAEPSEQRQLGGREPTEESRTVALEQRERELGNVRRNGEVEISENSSVAKSSSGQSILSKQQAATTQGRIKQGHSPPVKLAQDGLQQELSSNREGQRRGGGASTDQMLSDRTEQGQADKVSERGRGQGSLEAERGDRMEKNGQESGPQRTMTPPAVPPRKGKSGVRDEEAAAEGVGVRAERPTGRAAHRSDHTHTSTNAKTGDGIQSPASRDSIQSPASKKGIELPVSKNNIQSAASRDSIQSPASRDSIQSPASKKGIELPVSKNNIQSAASRDSILSPASRDSIQSPASRDNIQSAASRENIQSPASRENIQSPARKDSIQSAASRDSIHSQANSDNIQQPASRDSIQSPSAGRDNIQPLPCMANSQKNFSECNQNVNQESSIRRDTNAHTETHTEKGENKNDEKYRNNQQMTHTISTPSKSSSKQSVTGSQHKPDTVPTHTPKVKEHPEPTAAQAAEKEAGQKEGDSDREMRERDGETCGQTEEVRERDGDTSSQKEQKVKQGRSYVKDFLSLLGLASEERVSVDEDSKTKQDISKPDPAPSEPHCTDTPLAASVTIHDILQLQSPARSPSQHSDCSSHRAKENSGKAEMDYCVFSNPGSESDTSERLMMSPLSDMDKGGWVRSLIEHAHNLSPKNLTPVSVTPSQSNASSPTPAKPVLFKVKDNTFITPPVTKTVRPILHKSVQDMMAQPWSPRESVSDRGSERGSQLWSPRESLSGSEKGEDRGPDRADVDPKAPPGIPILVETASSPVLEDSAPTWGTAPVAPGVPASSPSQQPLGQMLTVPEEEAGRSSVSSGISSGLSECTKSVGDTCEETQLSTAQTDDTEGSKAPSERSGSVCSGTEGSAQTRKPPPAVLPKTEKALRRAMKLTTRRIQKAEGKGSRTDRKHHSNNGEGAEHNQKNRRGKGENSEEPEKSSSREKPELKQENHREELPEREHRNRDRERLERPERVHKNRDRERGERPEREYKNRDRERVERLEREHKNRDRERVERPEREHKNRDRETVEYAQLERNPHSNIDKHAQDKSEHSSHHGDRKGRSGEKHARLKHVSHSTDRHIGNHRDLRSHGNRRDSTEHAPEQQREHPQPYVRQSPGTGTGSHGDRRSRSLERDVPIQSEVLHQHWEKPQTGRSQQHDIITAGRSPRQPHDIITAGRSPRQPHDIITARESSGGSSRQPHGVIPAGESSGGSSRRPSLNRFLMKQDSSEHTHTPSRTRQENSEHTHTHHPSAGHVNSSEHTCPPSNRREDSSDKTHHQAVHQYLPLTRHQNQSEHQYPPSAMHQNSSGHQYPPPTRHQNQSEHQYPPTTAHNSSGHQYAPSIGRQNSSDFSYPPSIGRQNSSERSYPSSSSNLVAQAYPMTQRKLLQDPDSGQYFVVDMPVQVTTKTFFDPDTSSYVQLPVHAAEGAVPSGPSLEMLNPSLVLYHSFVPVPVSSRPSAKASSSSAAARPRPGDTEDMERSAPLWTDDPMHKCNRNEHPYIEPVYVPKDHTPEEELDSVR